MSAGHDTECKFIVLKKQVHRTLCSLGKTTRTITAAVGIVRVNSIQVHLSRSEHLYVSRCSDGLPVLNIRVCINTMPVFPRVASCHSPGSLAQKLVQGAHDLFFWILRCGLFCSSVCAVLWKNVWPFLICHTYMFQSIQLIVILGKERLSK